jgi:4-aminobutyrate aminotransferase / (S)-3-amino-2-methylpropionate transaminase / 5-aminovalerate transaminase
MLGQAPVEPTRPGMLEPAAAVASACQAARFVPLTCGTFGEGLRFRPPLVIGEDLLEEGLSIVEDGFSAL